MKKIIAVTALVLAGFAAPALPTQAAPMISKSDCLVLPLLKADCRAMMREDVKMAMGTPHTMAMSAPKVKSPLPMWWTCEPAPAGSKAMFVCD